MFYEFLKTKTQALATLFISALNILVKLDK